MDSHFEQARTFFLEGVAHYEAGRLPQAEQKFAASLALLPGRPSTLTNLGATRLKLGRPQEALALLEEALAQEPDNADALGHCATALAELGEPARALPLFERAVARAPGVAQLWLLRGNVLRELGRLQEAAGSYEAALARGGDEALLRYYLAGLKGGRVPATAPRDYVEALFDGYAGGFDAHLQALGYDAPARLAHRLAAGGLRCGRALDLGCGTGMCGPHLRRLAAHLTGVDLSAQMLERARSAGRYDVLVQDDLAHFLEACSDTFDLAMAADVFIYVGALEPVFAALARRMAAGGVFCFSVEESADAELELRASLRYAHSEPYLRRLAHAHGFAVTHVERAPVRVEQRQPIAGLFVWLERAG